MSTSWTLAAAEICNDALQHLGVLGDGETASGADMQIALRGLDGILKELPLGGYTWPKLSGEVALAYLGVATIALPADYYGYPSVWRTINGQRSSLVQIPHALWITRGDRFDLATTNSAGPTHFYIGPDKVLHLYPTPATSPDPLITIQYQKIVDDAALFNTPDLPQYWLNPLGYGVANEIALKFDTPQEKRIEIAQRWKAKYDRALENSIAHEVIEFSARD